MRCRLLYLVGQLRTGGSERQLFYLLQAMDRERYRPEVAVWSSHENDTYVPQIRNLGVPLHLFPRTFSRSAKMAKFRRLVEKPYTRSSPFLQFLYQFCCLVGHARVNDNSNWVHSK